MKVNMGKKDIVDILKDLLCITSGSVASQIAIKTFEENHLDKCPEFIFSSVIFNLVDLWMGAHNKGKDDFSKFMDTLKRAGIATYEEYEKEDK